MLKTKIMIVEDEGLVARDIEETLIRLGYDVVAIAHSGREAVEQAARHEPAVVLMDIILQGEMDGIMAAGLIREHSNIPIVYLTAYADQKTLERAKLTTPFGYILKPFLERELLTNIEIALYKHTVEMEREKLIKELQNALDRIKTLEGILPICSHCKKIRDYDGRWHEISNFIQDHSQAEFTHGICPDCITKYYPDFKKT
jgi:two-component system, response regulator PdtaR